MDEVSLKKAIKNSGIKFVPFDESLQPVLEKLQHTHCTLQRSCDLSSLNAGDLESDGVVSQEVRQFISKRRGKKTFLPYLHLPRCSFLSFIIKRENTVDLYYHGASKSDSSVVSLVQAMEESRRITEKNVLKWIQQLLTTILTFHKNYVAIGDFDLNDMYLRQSDKDLVQSLEKWDVGIGGEKPPAPSKKGEAMEWEDFGRQLYLDLANRIMDNKRKLKSFFELKPYGNNFNVSFKSDLSPERVSHLSEHYEELLRCIGSDLRCLGILIMQLLGRRIFHASELKFWLSFQFPMSKEIWAEEMGVEVGAGVGGVGGGSVAGSVAGGSVAGGSVASGSIAGSVGVAGGGSVAGSSVASSKGGGAGSITRVVERIGEALHPLLPPLLPPFTSLPTPLQQLLVVCMTAQSLPAIRKEGKKTKGRGLVSYSFPLFALLTQCREGLGQEVEKIYEGNKYVKVSLWTEEDERKRLIAAEERQAQSELAAQRGHQLASLRVRQFETSLSDFLLSPRSRNRRLRIHQVGEKWSKLRHEGGKLVRAAGWHTWSLERLSAWVKSAMECMYHVLCVWYVHTQMLAPQQPEVYVKGLLKLLLEICDDGIMERIWEKWYGGVGRRGLQLPPLTAPSSPAHAGSSHAATSQTHSSKFLDFQALGVRRFSLTNNHVPKMSGTSGSAASNSKQHKSGVGGTKPSAKAKPALFPTSSSSDPTSVCLDHSLSLDDILQHKLSLPLRMAIHESQFLSEKRLFGMKTICSYIGERIRAGGVGPASKQVDDGNSTSQQSAHAGSVDEDDDEASITAFALCKILRLAADRGASMVSERGEKSLSLSPQQRVFKQLCSAAQVMSGQVPAKGLLASQAEPNNPNANANATAAVTGVSLLRPLVYSLFDQLGMRDRSTARSVVYFMSLAMLLQFTVDAPVRERGEREAAIRINAFMRMVYTKLCVLPKIRASREIAVRGRGRSRKSRRRKSVLSSRSRSGSGSRGTSPALEKALGSVKLSPIIRKDESKEPSKDSEYLSVQINLLPCQGFQVKMRIEVTLPPAPVVSASAQTNMFSAVEEDPLVPFASSVVRAYVLGRIVCVYICGAERAQYDPVALSPHTFLEKFGAPVSPLPLSWGGGLGEGKVWYEVEVAGEWGGGEDEALRCHSAYDIMVELDSGLCKAITKKNRRKSEQEGVFSPSNLPFWHSQKVKTKGRIPLPISPQCVLRPYTSPLLAPPPTAPGAYEVQLDVPGIGMLASVSCLLQVRYAASALDLPRSTSYSLQRRAVLGLSTAWLLRFLAGRGLEQGDSQGSSNVESAWSKWITKRKFLPSSSSSNSEEEEKGYVSLYSTPWETSKEKFVGEKVPADDGKHGDGLLSAADYVSSDASPLSALLTNKLQLVLKGLYSDLLAQPPDASAPSISTSADLVQTGLAVYVQYRVQVHNSYGSSKGKPPNNPSTSSALKPRGDMAEICQVLVSRASLLAVGKYDKPVVSEKQSDLLCEISLAPEDDEVEDTSLMQVDVAASSLLVAMESGLKVGEEGMESVLTADSLSVFSSTAPTQTPPAPPASPPAAVPASPKHRLPASPTSPTRSRSRGRSRGKSAGRDELSGWLRSLQINSPFAASIESDKPIK